jgi:hypothetical protein
VSNFTPSPFLWIDGRLRGYLFFCVPQHRRPHVRRNGRREPGRERQEGGWGCCTGPPQQAHNSQMMSSNILYTSCCRGTLCGVEVHALPPLWPAVKVRACHPHHQSRRHEVLGPSVLNRFVNRLLLFRNKLPLDEVGLNSFEEAVQYIKPLI